MINNGKQSVSHEECGATAKATQCKTWTRVDVDGQVATVVDVEKDDVGQLGRLRMDDGNEVELEHALLQVDVRGGDVCAHTSSPLFSCSICRSINRCASGWGRWRWYRWFRRWCSRPCHHPSLSVLFSKMRQDTEIDFFLCWQFSMRRTDWVEVPHQWSTTANSASYQT